MKNNLEKTAESNPVESKPEKKEKHPCPDCKKEYEQLYQLMDQKSDNIKRCLKCTSIYSGKIGVPLQEF